MELEKLLEKRKNLRKIIGEKNKILENVRRIFTKRKFEYHELLEEYKETDYKLAEIDGRLVNVTLVRKKRKKKPIALSDLTIKQIDELKESLLKSIEKT